MQENPDVITLNIAPKHGEIWTPSITWFLGPIKSTFRMAPWQFSCFLGLTVITDRQSDRPCYSVSRNRTHLASAAMWQKKIR